MTLKVYLSGEIHTDWRDRLVEGASGLDVSFSGPVTDHDASDDCGAVILGGVRGPNALTKNRQSPIAPGIAPTCAPSVVATLRTGGRKILPQILRLVSCLSG